MIEDQGLETESESDSPLPPPADKPASANLDQRPEMPGRGVTGTGFGEEVRTGGVAKVTGVWLQGE